MSAYEENVATVSSFRNYAKMGLHTKQSHAQTSRRVTQVPDIFSKDRTRRDAARFRLGAAMGGGTRQRIPIADPLRRSVPYRIRVYAIRSSGNHLLQRHDSQEITRWRV